MEYVLEFIRSAQKKTSGQVKVQLYKGNTFMKGRKSPFSLYDMKLSSMQEGGG